MGSDTDDTIVQMLLCECSRILGDGDRAEWKPQTIEDVVEGRLRSPSSLMELSSLEISPALLQIKNFRLPPLMEIGVLAKS
jgi:hypothetical protein